MFRNWKKDVKELRKQEEYDVFFYISFYLLPYFKTDRNQRQRVKKKKKKRRERAHHFITVLSFLFKTFRRMVNLSPEHKLQKTESINQSILPLAILPFLNSASLA